MALDQRRLIVQQFGLAQRPRIVRNPAAVELLPLLAGCVEAVALSQKESERPRLGGRQLGEALPPTEPGSLAFFLTERYCLYAACEKGQRLYRGRISHDPWPLRSVELLQFDSTLVEGHGLPTPVGPPVLHAGGPLHVSLWALQRV